MVGWGAGPGGHACTGMSTPQYNKLACRAVAHLAQDREKQERPFQIQLAVRQRSSPQHVNCDRRVVHTPQVLQHGLGLARRPEPVQRSERRQPRRKARDLERARLHQSGEQGRIVHSVRRRAVRHEGGRVESARPVVPPPSGRRSPPAVPRRRKLQIRSVETRATAAAGLQDG
eukprot:scaffold11681_cov79-Isochrysis_galbana.AAC.1